MTHSIKVSDEVFQTLRQLQKPRESYNEILSRVLAAYQVIQGIRDGLPASHWLQERPHDIAKDKISPQS